MAISGRCFNGVDALWMDGDELTVCCFEHLKDIIHCEKRGGYEVTSTNFFVVEKTSQFWTHGFHFHGAIGIYFL